MGTIANVGPRAVDLTGQRFARLVVKERNGSRPSGQALWLCVCDCGKEKTIAAFNLRKGFVRSCGCLLDESRKKKRTPEQIQRMVSASAETRASKEYRDLQRERHLKYRIDARQATAFYESGMTTEEVGKTFGVSRCVIEKTLKHAGVSFRVGGFSRGVKHPDWNSGDSATRGYRLVKDPSHYRTGEHKKNFIFEHVLVMEKHIGRRLAWHGKGHDLSELVHHKNGCKTDNRIENLEIVSPSQHAKIHQEMARENRVFVAVLRHHWGAM